MKSKSKIILSSLSSGCILIIIFLVIAFFAFVRCLSDGYPDRTHPDDYDETQYPEIPAPGPAGPLQ